ARVDHGRGLVDPPADPRDDALDDLEEVRAVPEDDVRALEAAPTLDVHVARAIHENVGDRPILHQRLDRSQAERLVRDLDDESIAVRATEWRSLGLEHALHHAMDLRLHGLGGDEGAP